MSSEPTRLSDKALAVFAFAIFHQLESSKPVSHVVLSDGAGHRADPDAVSGPDAPNLNCAKSSNLNGAPSLKVNSAACILI